jgi:hypothetical protein
LNNNNNKKKNKTAKGGKVSTKEPNKNLQHGGVAEEVAGPWFFPEPATLSAPLLRAAGPMGGLPLGWPLEELGGRVVELQERGQLFGLSKLNGSLFEELLRRGDGRQARRLVHAKLVADYLRAGKVRRMKMKMKKKKK